MRGREVCALCVATTLVNSLYTPTPLLFFLRLLVTHAQAPTLVYEPKFPRTRERRWRYIASKLLEMAVCGAGQYIVLRQFMLPVLHKEEVEQGTLPFLGNVAFDMMKRAYGSCWECWQD